MVELGLPLGSAAMENASRKAPWLPQDMRDRDLHDTYILGELLGRGATSTVYKCLLKGKTECACKVLNKSLLNRRRVECELQDLLALRHPHLIQLRDVFETPDELSLVMELAKGGELLERIAERGFYSEETAAKAVRQVLSAIQCLHTGGHAHRAIRPEKLLFATDAEEAPLKLLAVGLGEPRLLVTSAPYCAPEASCGHEAGPEADMWCIGVITYIMLCGMEPFVSEESSDSHSLRFPSPWWNEVSESARDLVAQLLQVDPRARLTAEQALQHPWVRGDTTCSKHMDATVRSLREFNARRKFRAATQAVVATQRMVSPEKRLSRVLGQGTPDKRSPESGPHSPSHAPQDGVERRTGPTRC